jgi:hypothetical protein
MAFVHDWAVRRRLVQLVEQLLLRRRLERDTAADTAASAWFDSVTAPSSAPER